MEIELDVVQFGNQFNMEGINVDRPEGNNPRPQFNQPAGQANQPAEIPEEQPNIEPENQANAPAGQAANNPLAQEEVNPGNANANAADGQEKVEEPEPSINKAKEEIDPILTPKGTEMKGFSCMICYDPFNTEKRIPKVFPCGHTFCLSCVQGLMKNRTFMSSSTVYCPTCRQNTRYSMSAGAEKVPTNFCILAMLEQRKEESSPKEENEMLQCRECNEQKICTEITICNERDCQNIIDEAMLEDCDKIKRAKCLLICRACIETKHVKHNFIPFEKVVAQYEANERICFAESLLAKGMKSADDAMHVLRLTETEVLDHRKRMVNALANIRAQADHPQIYEYLNRFTESAESSEALFRFLVGDLNLFDFKSKCRYYRAFGVDELRPVVNAPKVKKRVVKEEPRDDVPNQAPRGRAHEARLNRPQRVARFNVIGPFPARNPIGNNAGDPNQLPPIPDIGNMLNRVLQQLDVGQGIREFPPIFPPGQVPPVPEVPGVGDAAGADPQAPADLAAARENRLANLGDVNMWAVRAPIAGRRLRRDPNIRLIRQNLIAAMAANPVLEGIPAIQQAIDGLRDNRDILDDPFRPLFGDFGFAQDINRIRERLNRLEAMQPNQRDRQQELMQNFEQFQLPFVDQIVEEPLAALPPILGVEPEMVQRAEINELVGRIMNMVRNEAYAEAVANRQPLPHHVEMPPMLNPGAIPGVPDYNNLLPAQVAPFLADLRVLELEWIQRGRDRRARAAAVVEPNINEQPQPVRHIENEGVPQNPAPVQDDVDLNRDLPPRENTPVPDEPAAKRNRQ
ncbi:hypothetical protein CAEBREN_02584 [Caenorhabditis brenneri]|uniref:RING-type domain-containing protein n=1 Tax=Caenorhabditis brenneri TaxID=135651 RepID=G0NJM6_CAEBE|nr:hypothetical protein CAEBREN_02584 [Caenorhabditis brenneri]